MSRASGGGAVLGLVGLGAVAAILFWRRREGGNATAAGAFDGSPAKDEADALARVITSEADRYSLTERRAIAWTVRNRARKRGTTIVKLVCSPTCGQQGPGRPFSSARPATAVNLALAHEVLAAPQSDDPTHGALAFFEPAVQDKLVAQGRPGYRYTSAELRAKWQREGQQTKGAVGAFEFFA